MKALLIALLIAKVSDQDLQVMAHIHDVNQMEIDMGHLAQRNGATPGVKAYGKTLVADHHKGDKAVLALANKHGQTIPKEAPANEMDKDEMKSNMDAMKRLHTLKGADFDRELLQIAVQAHEKELARTETAIGQVNDEGLKALLTEMKPVLQKHIDLARELQNQSSQASK
jgi:putative membrane protein